MDPILWNIANADDDDDGIVSKKPPVVTCLVLLVDASPEMFDAVGGVQPMRRVMEAVYNMLCQKCSGGERQYTSITFVHTDTSNVDGDKAHLYDWHKCALPTKEMTKAVRDVSTSKDIRKAIGALCGCEGDSRAEWSDAFWLAARTLNADRQYGSKRVVVFTVDERPHNDDAVVQARITGKLKALHDADCSVLVIHPLGGEHFNRALFWAAAQSGTSDEADELAASSLDEWCSSVRRKDVKQRSLGNIDFTLGDGVTLSVHTFNMVQTADRPAHTWLDAQRNEECRPTTTYYNEETGSKLIDRDMHKYQTYGGERIAMTFPEVAALGRMMAPGMRLLGFKPVAAVLDAANYVHASLYVFPDNATTRGSGELYSALLRRCLDRKVAPICGLVTRANNHPSLVALLPRDIVYDEDGRVETNPAFHVIRLPFADNLRDLSAITGQVDAWPRPSDEQTLLAENVVESLMWTGYHAEAIDNPTLQRHYRGVEAMAMDIVDYRPEDVVDGTKPNTASITKRAGAHLDELITASFAAGYDPERVGTGAKKAKETCDEPAVDLREEHKSGKLTKLTVAVLKAGAAKLKIKLKMTKKADIIAEIEKWLQAH